MALDGETAVIGAHADNHAVGEDQGSGWSQQAYLVGSDSFNEDHFGQSVSLDLALRRRTER